ncbi:hypothetical protein TWF481_003167 [Arthrobotrys musiformis]|uniref:Uncharacterized protein n=1 Tax=Arthrobotrys musiformis TaxID=47236 RepID=A0AAV9VRK8_9PEZI
MCWNILIGRCSHPEPLPDFFPSPTSCPCNTFRTSWSASSCGPCKNFLVDATIDQIEFIDAQLYNRNVTYFLQTSNEFGVKYDRLPERIAEWVALPNHVRFTVNDRGTLLEGVGNRCGNGVPIVDDTDGDDNRDVDGDGGDSEDSGSTLVGSGPRSTGSENGNTTVEAGTILDNIEDEAIVQAVLSIMLEDEVDNAA